MKIFFYVRLGLVFSLISILAGALVRATNSGDGCGSTWPTCNGKIIPTFLDLNEAIEFSHRIVSGILLIITLIIFIQSRQYQKHDLNRKIVNYLTFFVVFEAVIGAVIVIYEWVGLNSSLPRIIAVPIHLVNTFGLLGSYALLYKSIKYKIKDLSFLFNKKFIFISLLFLVTAATGSIAALADVLFPNETFIEGLLADFDKSSQILTRLRILHPIFSTVLALVLYFDAKTTSKSFEINTSLMRTLILITIFLGITNVLLNLVLLLSIIHLASADLLWITYIYVSMEKYKNNPSLS